MIIFIIDLFADYLLINCLALKTRKQNNKTVMSPFSRAQSDAFRLIFVSDQQSKTQRLYFNYYKWQRTAANLYN